jgi:cobalt-zinc-cadmium efflux system protein
MSGVHRHSHSHAPKKSGQTRLGLAAVLTGGFMLAEIAGGLLSGSLALLADAGHMFTDFGALVLAWGALWMQKRPADWRRTYGFDRLSVLVAFVNGLGLFVIAAVILLEAVQRVMSPTAVAGPMMLAVAAAGLVVNLVVLWMLQGAEKQTLNLRAASLHVLGDLLGSVAAILAAVIIIFTGWTLADPLLSVAVVALILLSAYFVVRDSAHILLEASPVEIDSRRIADDLVAHVDGIKDVHHVHVWSISEERPMVTLHARLAAGRDAESAIAAVKARLASRFDIDHATVEIEFGECADASGGAAGRRDSDQTPGQHGHRAHSHR